MYNRGRGDIMRDRIIKYLLISLAAMNAADYLFTVRAIHTLGVPEGNPVMDALIGTPWFAVIKLVLVPAGLYLIWRCRGRVRRVIYYAGAASAAYGALTAWHFYGQFVM